MSIWEKYYSKPNPVYGNKVQFGMLIDISKCLGCHTCSMACKSTWTDNPGQEDMYWNNVNTKPYGKYPREKGSKDPVLYDYKNSNLYEDTPMGKYPNLWQFYLPRPCNHCATPACLPACPTRAIYKRADGIVLIDQNKCQGYQYCIKACPYKKIYYNKATKTGQKCIMCYPLLEKGREPQCVSSCTGKIRIFGDLMDPNSTISQIIRDPEKGARPYRPESKFKAVHRYLNKGERRQYRPDWGTIPSIWYIPPKNVPPEEAEKYFGHALKGLISEPYTPEGPIKFPEG
ncbi:MAG: hypothetical protein A2073_04550 [Deltaproteobacteria bacterium GWC2_42_11]|nr:MAG: hypothetical protein A2073_04550 [Deltaproteobacteria bacterium GWC2_42_11]